MKIELSKLFLLLENNKDIVSFNASDSAKMKIIQRAIEYIELNYMREITIEQISIYVNFSKSYFMNCFKNIVGISVFEYIIKFRIKKACELICEGQKSITQIAFDCGFNNLSNFNRHYKRILGCTPKEYKNNAASLLKYK